MTPIINHDYSNGSQDTATFSKNCIHCGAQHNFKISMSSYDKLFYKHQFMQDVFPHLDHIQRETMISGTCPACWEEIFADIED